MQITYDKKSDCKYIAFQKRKRGIVARTEQLADWLMVDYTKDGSLYGVEVLNASQHPGILRTIVNQVIYSATAGSQDRKRVSGVADHEESSIDIVADYAYA